MLRRSGVLSLSSNHLSILPSASLVLASQSGVNVMVDGHERRIKRRTVYARAYTHTAFVVLPAGNRDDATTIIVRR
jgi:hypothetical protein